MAVVGYEADEFPGVKKVHQKSVTGRFRTIKSAVLIAMMIGFYGLAWLPWDRPGAAADQAFLMSFTEGKFYAMWFTFWPQDLYLLTLVLLFSAFGLFFTNTIVGRVWCGFSCPQTLWTDGFQFIERLFEGDRNDQLRRHKEGLTPTKPCPQGRQARHLVDHRSRHRRNADRLLQRHLEYLLWRRHFVGEHAGPGHGGRFRRPDLPVGRFRA